MGLCGFISDGGCERYHGVVQLYYDEDARGTMGSCRFITDGGYEKAEIG